MDVPPALRQQPCGCSSVNTLGGVGASVVRATVGELVAGAGVGDAVVGGGKTSFATHRHNAYLTMDMAGKLFFGDRLQIDPCTRMLTSTAGLTHWLIEDLMRSA